jgi:hypothetical protein
MSQISATATTAGADAVSNCRYSWRSAYVEYSRQYLRAVESPALESQPVSGEVWADPHCAVAARAWPRGTVRGVCGANLGRFRRGGKKPPCECQHFGAPGVSEKPKLPDADEAPRQNVLGKSAQKLRCLKSHLALLVAMRVVLSAKGNALSIESQ